MSKQTKVADRDGNFSFREDNSKQPFTVVLGDEKSELDFFQLLFPITLIQLLVNYMLIICIIKLREQRLLTSVVDRMFPINISNSR